MATSGTRCPTARENAADAKMRTARIRFIDSSEIARLKTNCNRTRSSKVVELKSRLQKTQVLLTNTRKDRRRSSRWIGYHSVRNCRFTAVGSEPVGNLAVIINCEYGQVSIFPRFD